LDEVGDEVKRVHLPDYMDPRHTVQSQSGTFIVSHRNTQLKQRQWPPHHATKVNIEG